LRIKYWVYLLIFIDKLLSLFEIKRVEIDSENEEYVVVAFVPYDVGILYVYKRFTTGKIYDEMLWDEYLRLPWKIGFYKTIQWYWTI